MTSTAAPNLAGLWLGVSELAAAVQGTWQAASVARAGHGGQLLRAGPGEQKQKALAAEAAAAGRTATEDVGRCGGAMSDTTLYLLLDRFSPS